MILPHLLTNDLEGNSDNRTRSSFFDSFACSGFTDTTVLVEITSFTLELDLAAMESWTLELLLDLLEVCLRIISLDLSTETFSIIFEGVFIIQRILIPYAMKRFCLGINSKFSNHSDDRIQGK
uniref:Uncharacterized protein n=1 Tax=Kalanchoe fedtschenkoi TaxID=63787 RepID=A0A7N0ZWN3_KALFE